MTNNKQAPQEIIDRLRFLVSQMEKFTASGEVEMFNRCDSRFQEVLSTLTLLGFDTSFVWNLENA